MMFLIVVSQFCDLFNVYVIKINVCIALFTQLELITFNAMILIKIFEVLQK